MKPTGPTSRRGLRITRARLARLVVTLSLLLALSGVASAYWSAGSAPGGNGVAVEAIVNRGATPTASAAGTAVTVSWAASTLSNGRAVDGYLVKRYDVATLSAQTISSACTGTLTAMTCTESNVPSGQWVYSVTPVFATSWRGAESVKSSSVNVAASTLALTSTTVRPGTSLTGTAAGFPVAEILRYRLDSPTGVELTGSLAGLPTPALVSIGGGGAVIVSVPAGTSDGPHTIYAVTSPSGAAASAGIVVDGTPPPPPVLTLTPTFPSYSLGNIPNSSLNTLLKYDRLENPTSYATWLTGPQFCCSN